MVQVSRVYPTSLTSFKKCSQQWSYSQQPDLPVLPMEQDVLLFGSAVHQAIEAYYAKIDENPRPVQIDTLAKQMFADFVGSQFRYLKQRYENCVTNFIRFETERLKKFKVYKPTLVERKLQDGILGGKMDAYFQTDQTVLDWKTGSPSMGEELTIQGAFYRKVLNDLNMPCTRVLFVDLNHGKVLEAPAVTDAWLQAQVDYMLQGEVKPSPGPWCNYCGFVIRCEFSRNGIGNMWSLC